MAHQLQVTGSASLAFMGGSGNVITGADNLGDLFKVTIGSNLTLSGGVLSATGGGTGSVTSVGLTSTAAAFTISNSPITTSGNIGLNFSGNSGQYVAGDGSLVTFPSIITQAQNLVTEVYNETGATLTKGTVVYINGGHGNLPTVTKAIATSDATSAQTYGIVRANITNNNNGYVTVIGNLDNMDTQAYPNGTQLYLSSTIAGAYTSVKQYAPAHLVYVGIVTRSHPTQGIIEVKIQNGFEMDELHNVSAQSPVNGSILQYSTSTSLWNAVAGTTTNIAEGDNLYFTNARARGVLSTNVGSALSYNSTTGRFTLVAAESGVDGYLTGTDYDYFDSKQNSLGTGTVDQFLRGDLVWATPPTPDLGDLGDVAITTPTNGQVLTYRVGTWKNETPAAAPVLSVFGRTGIIVATSGDYTTDQVTEATNLYYTNARARGSVSVDVGSALTYNSTTGRFSLPAADGGVAGYVTTTDYNYWDSKQDSLGTGTTSQYLRGDLTWSTPPAPALDDLTDVTITSPTNGQLLRYQAGTWINFTPTYVAAGFFSATAPLSYNSTTGVFSISQATTSTNGYLSSTDWNTFNGKQAQINGTGFVKASGTTISYDNTNYLPLTGGTMSGILYGNGGGNFYIYNYGRTGLPNAGKILYNNGTGANMFFGEIATHIYGFTSNAYTDTAALSINLNATKVGIGISNPGYLLTLYEATLPQIAFQNSGAVRAIIGADSGSLALNSLTSSPITFNVDSVERIRLTSTGNLGIGTTAPASKLEVYKTDGSYNLYTRINLDVSTDLFAKVYMGSGLTGGYIGYDESGSERLVLNAANSTATMQFLIAGSEKMRLTSSGYFGINTTTPTYPLEVNGVSFFNGGFNLASTVRCRWGGNNTPALGFPFGGSDTGNALFIEAADSDSGGIAICNDGVTVYGAADSGFVFRAIDEDVYQSTSDVSASTNFYVNQGLNGGAYFRGNVTVNSGNVTATAFFESSDKRLKKELNDNPIVNGISDIKPKLYIKDGKEELGYYAQDLEQILPSAVSEGKDGFLSLSYTQVHSAKIAQLEGEITELKQIVKTLINELGRNK